MSNQHDKSYKTILSKKRNFMTFLRQFVKADWVKYVDEDSLHMCDKAFVDPFFDELESDIIYRAKISGTDVYFYVLTELQSSVDFTMPFRIFYYMAAILKRVFNDTEENKRKRASFKLPVVIPIVFYNGSGKWNVTTNLGSYQEGSELLGHYIDIRYHLVDISEIDPQDLLSSLNAISAIITVDKERGSDPLQVFYAISNLMKAEEEFDSHEDFNDFRTWLVHMLSYMKFSRDETEILLESMKKGDEDMTSSIQLAAERILDEGRVEGKAEGKAEGFIESALRLLNKGFKVQDAIDLLDLDKDQAEQVKIASLSR